MKRLLCLLVCLVLMLGLLPAAAGAASRKEEIDEVSLSGLDHPVMGELLDFTYKLPSKVNYAKDSEFDEVTWYDLGTDDKETNAKLKSGARAEEGHSYLAELHLIVTDDDKYYFSEDTEVALSHDMELRADAEAVPFDRGESDRLIIRLTYEADYYYDYSDPVKLTVDETMDGTVIAGESPWTESDFSGYDKRHFDLTVTWYSGKEASSRYEMNRYDKFEAGQTYTLKVELDSARLSRHAFFDPDVDIMINGKKGNTYTSDDPDYSAYALFRFTASSSVDKVVIKGIEEPVVGETRQRSGFTCSTDGVEVDYDHWDVVDSTGKTKDFRGTFEAGYTYLLTLELEMEDGSFPKDFSKKQVSVNAGTVDSVDPDGDICTVVVKFELDDLLLSEIYVSAEPRDTEYSVGDRFNSKGLEITAVYADGHKAKVSDIKYSPSGPLEKEDTVITISYTEDGVTKKTELNITVVDDDLTLKGIVITTKPDKTSYKTGEIFDPKGMVVVATYDDKSTAEVTNLEFDPDGKLTLNDDEIEVLYREGSKTAKALLSIKVVEAKKDLVDLKLSKDPYKTEYEEGEEFDPLGMVLTATYDDESTATIPFKNCTATPSGPLKKTDTRIVITYEENDEIETVVLSIKVKEASRKLSSLVVSTKPAKLTYKEGEEFDPKGMVITAVYDDKSTAEVAQYTITPTGKLTKAVTALEISYTEGSVTKTVSLPITVNPILVNPFTDVKETDYFYDAVLWAYYNDPQVTNGMTDTEFSPYTTCNRGQVVTFLWRAAGKPVPTTQTNPFTDVAEGSWYRDAVLWAVEKGITNGTSATTFDPAAPCTLAHVITFLYRAADEPGKSAAPETWYTDAMNWAFDNGLFKNLSLPDIQEPMLPCPRRDIVNFLYIQLG